MSTQEANIDYRLYKKINEKPGSSIRELANEMGWSIVEVFNLLPKESPSFRVGRNWALP